MAKMLIQSESLTAIADKIRVLSGTEDAMSLNAMESHVGEANTDVATEADLIEQIASALEGKAGGGIGGGDDGENITFSVVNNLPDIISIYGKLCIPYETTVVSVTHDANQSFGMPITIWTNSFNVEEQRDYSNNYNVWLSYPMIDDDGELYNEIFSVYMAVLESYPFAVLGITEVVPFGSAIFTIYCEEV